MEKKAKFKVGDRVIGNEKAKKYNITTVGTVWRVTEVNCKVPDWCQHLYPGHPSIRVASKSDSSGYLVEPDCFDLYPDGKILIMENDGSVIARNLNTDRASVVKSTGNFVADARQVFNELLKDEKQYYTGKVACVRNESVVGERFFTIGKVYKIQNGTLKDNTGTVYTYQIESIERLNFDYPNYRFIEFKE